MVMKFLLFDLWARYWKVVPGLMLCLFPGLLSNLMAQSALRTLIVKKIPVTTEARINDPDLADDSYAYRVFAEMDSAYEIQAVFGLENHALIFKTSTFFYNNSDFGGTSGRDMLSALLFQGMVHMFINLTFLPFRREFMNSG